MDEPTEALGVKESGRVLELIREVRAHGVPVLLISLNMPQVFEVADRGHIVWLAGGWRRSRRRRIRWPRPWR